MQKSIAIFTGTRAEYGLLRPVLQKLEKSELIKVNLIVTGAHLSAAYGNTVDEIKADNIEIAKCIDILKFENDTLSTAKTVALAIDLFSKWLNETKPDAILLLGDRYEMFAAATAAAMLKIPIAHISGGDVTTGAADEFYRHCITKMASLHFPSCKDSARRIVQLGEAPSSVYCVGGLGDENIRSMKLLPKKQLLQSLGIPYNNPYMLITYHPETAGNVNLKEQMNELLRAVEKLDLTLIFTKANADAGGTSINNMLDAFCNMHDNAYAFTSLGSLKYLSCMKYACAIVGNSSSGVVETPTLGVPCINIGNRQNGRIITGNVICCKANSADISSAIKKAVSPEFFNIAHYVQSPYHGGNTSGKIVRRLEEYLTSNKFKAVKVFYDISPKEGSL